MEKTLRKKKVRFAAVLLATAMAGVLAGCVKRTILIESDPPGAEVWINEHRIGTAPIAYEFITHGRYKFRLEKTGFREVIARERVMAPVYEWIPLDFIFEILVPLHLEDRHAFRYTLEPLPPAERMKTDEPVDLKGILAGLDNADPVRRRAACVALARLRDPSSAAAAQSATHDPDPTVRTAALEAFRALKGREALPRLLEVLRQDVQPEVRWQAAAELEILGSKEAVLGLITALNDKSHLVRAGAAEALKGIPDPRSVQPLIRTLNDTDTAARRAAAEALGIIGDRAAVRPLMRALRVHDFQTRRRAIKSLRQLQDPSCGPALIRSLNDWDPKIRSVAVESLIAFGNKEQVVPPLIQYLHSWQAVIREDAARALGGLQDQRAVEPLVRAFWREPNPTTSTTMLAALKSLGAQIDTSWEQTDLYRTQKADQIRRRKARELKKKVK